MDFIRDFFKGLASSPTEKLPVFRIPNQNIDITVGFDKFDSEKHYFTVRVNEMFLSKKRKWFTEIEPMVICLTSYTYGSREIDNLFIVGKNLMKDKLTDVPGGMAYYDTRVAGIHPYAGGRLVLGICLCQSVTKDYIKNTLDFAEKVAGILNKNIPMLIGNYTEIANTVINSVNELMKSDDVKPLIGCRLEIDPDSNDFFSGGYYAMLDKTDKDWDQDKFFVKDKRLFYGDDAESSKPFRDDEFVLFSVTQSEVRSEENQLPFYKSFQKILDLGSTGVISQEVKDKMTAQLMALNFEMQQSPDLTPSHAEKLMEEYFDKVKKAINKNFTLAPGDKKTDKTFWDKMDAEIKSI